MSWWSMAESNRRPLQCECSALANWANTPGARSGNRTRTPFGQGILSPSCIPVSPSALSFVKWRRLPELNRCERFCRPLRNHSAKAPFEHQWLSYVSHWKSIPSRYKAQAICSINHKVNEICLGDFGIQCTVLDNIFVDDNNKSRKKASNGQRAKQKLRLRPSKSLVFAACLGGPGIH